MGSPYQNQVVETAGQEDLVVLLYAGARRFTDLGARALAQQDYPQASRHVGRAQAILEHLSATVDRERGGEVAANLVVLYQYWFRRLSDGLVQRTPAALAEVSAHLADFHGAWQEGARQARALRARGTTADGQ